MRFKQISFTTVSLVFLSIVLSLTQFIWSFSGADRAFLEAPEWITFSRGISALFFVCSFFLFRPNLETKKYSFNLEFWIGLLAVYILFRGIYVETQIPKFTSFASYFVLSLFILNLRTLHVNVSTIQFPLRVLVYGSILELIFFPNLSFIESKSRFGLFFEFNRFCGLVGHPSLFSFIAFLYLITIVLIRSQFWKIEFFLVLIFLVLANTASVLICVPLLYFLIQKSNTSQKLLKFLVCVIPLISFYVLITTLKEKISDTAIQGDDLLNSRPSIWHWAIDTWKQSPTLGLSTEQLNYDLGYSDSIYWVHAHNQVLQELISGGVFRLALMLVIFFALCRFTLCQLDNSRFSSGIAFILFVCQSTSEVPFTFNTVDFRFFTFLIFITFYFADFDEGSNLR